VTRCPRCNYSEISEKDNYCRICSLNLKREAAAGTTALEKVIENILRINGGQFSDNFLKDVVQTLLNPKSGVLPRVSILEVGQSDLFTCTAIKQGKEFCASGNGPTAMLLVHL
jgi:hypothetical protein